MMCTTCSTGRACLVSEPVALDYGQTRALICDLNGMVLDISTPTELLAGREEGGVETDERRDDAGPDQPEENRWGYDRGLRH